MRHVMQQSVKYGETERVQVPTFYQNQSERGGTMEKSKTSKMQSLLLTLILVVIALWVSPAAVAAEKKMVTDPSTGKMVTAPEYGGTLTYVFTGDPQRTDAWFGGSAGYVVSGVYREARHRELGHRQGRRQLSSPVYS